MTPERSRCRAKNPSTCRHHGGRVVDGRRAPRPWLGSVVPKTASKGWKGNTRQIHGFRNEYRVCSALGLQKMDKYTSEWDAYTVANHPLPVSIKMAKKGSSIMMGDFFRNASKTEDFILHVSLWQEDKKVVEEHMLLIPASYWSKQFDRSIEPAMRETIAKATPAREYDATWKAETKALAHQWAELVPSSVVRLAPKRDHKVRNHQKRMQCHITYTDFREMCKMFEITALPSTRMAEVVQFPRSRAVMGIAA